MIGRLIFIAALAAASAASAQETAAPPPATAEQVAQARATADRLIREAGAETIFVNKTDSALPQVEHVASGMRCLFNGNAHDRILIFPVQTDSVPRGDDVGCVTKEESLRIDTTTYATRYRPLPTEAAAMGDAVRAIRARWPDAAPYEEGLVSMGSDRIEPPLTAAFKVNTPDGPMLTLALIDHLNGWAYKVRATGPLEDAMLTSLYAGTMMAVIQGQATNGD
jgi:hypothetical protein